MLTYRASRERVYFLQDCWYQHGYAPATVPTTTTTTGMMIATASAMIRINGGSVMAFMS